MLIPGYNPLPGISGTYGADDAIPVHITRCLHMIVLPDGLTTTDQIFRWVSNDVD